MNQTGDAATKAAAGTDSLSSGASSEAAAAAPPSQIRLWKKLRTTTKVGATKAVNSANQLLANPQTKFQDLRVCRSKLHDHLGKLTQSNELLLPHLPDDDLDNELQDYSTREQTMSDLMFRIDAVLAEREKADRDKAFASKSSSSNGFAAATGGSKSSTKLPKLQIKPFSGDPLKWREFWDSFEVSVHANSSLSPIEKFQYLKSFLENEALSLLEGYSLSDATYDTTVAALKERFDQPELCINIHLDQMIYMEEGQNNVVEMQSTFDQCEAHIRGLVCLGMAEVSFERVFAPLMLSKFPQAVRIDLNRRNGLGNAWTLANLRQFLKEEISARKLGSLTVGTSSDGGDGSNGRPRSGGGNSGVRFGTAAGLIGSGKPKKPPADTRSFPYLCTYCQSEDHRSEDCNQFLTANERRTALGRDQCLVCLRRNHKASQCRSSHACKYCGVAKSHHHSLCFKKFGSNSKSDDASGLNADAEPFIPAGSLVAPAASNQQQSRGCAILGTAIAAVTGAFRKLKVRVVLDSCATRSFARLDLLKQLGATKIEDEHLGLAGLAEGKRQYDKFGCYELKIVCLDGEEVPIAVTGLETITCPIDRQPFSAEQYPILKKFTLADPPQNQPDTVQLDVLIGLDHYYRFVGHIAVRLSETLVLLDTKLGYVLNGSTKNLTSSRQRHSTALLCFDSPSGGRTLSKKLKRLWEVEDIGAVDVKSNVDKIAVIEKEIARHPEAKRCSTGLPWTTWNDGLAPGQRKRFLEPVEQGTMIVYDNTIKDQLATGINRTDPRSASGEEIHQVTNHYSVRPDTSPDVFVGAGWHHLSRTGGRPELWKFLPGQCNRTMVAVIEPAAYCGGTEPLLNSAIDLRGWNLNDIQSRPRSGLPTPGIEIPPSKMGSGISTNTQGSRRGSLQPEWGPGIRGAGVQTPAAGTSGVTGDQTLLQEQWINGQINPLPRACLLAFLLVYLLSVAITACKIAVLGLIFELVKFGHLISFTLSYISTLANYFIFLLPAGCFIIKMFIYFMPSLGGLLSKRQAANLASTATHAGASYVRDEEPQPASVSWDTSASVASSSQGKPIRQLAFRLLYMVWTSLFFAFGTRHTVASNCFRLPVVAISACGVLIGSPYAHPGGHGDLSSTSWTVKIGCHSNIFLAIQHRAKSDAINIIFGCSKALVFGASLIFGI